MTVPGPEVRSTWWRWAFIALILIECAPIWAFRYVPTHDGPSHLDNAAVIANYAAVPILREYYSLTLVQPAGNALAQIVLAGLLKTFSPLTAEKVFLTAYIVFFFLAFRYLLRALTPYADHFSCLAGVCVPSFFFYMGFWNFIAGSVLLLFTAGYVLRRTQRWTGRSLAALTVLACLLYGAHAVPWAVGVVAVAVLCLSDPALAYAMRRAGTPVAVSMRPGAVARHLVLPLLAVLVPAAALWLHLSRASQTPGCGPDTGLLAVLWPLYSLSFLHSLTVADIPLLKMLGAAVLLAAAAVAGVAMVRGGYERRSTGMLLLSLACAAIAIAGPDCIGTGLFVRSRVAFFSFIFLLAWMASALQRWPKPLLHGIPAVFCLFTAAFMVTRVPVVARWNDTLAGVTDVGQHVRPNSTVLQLDFAPLEGIDPALHAVGLISGRPIINLRNYEALADHFTTRFRPGMAPVPALGTMAQIRGVPPVFDVARYERETRGRVDYLLFNGWPEPRQAGDERPEAALYPEQLTAFTLVATSPDARFRLYERAVQGPR